MIYSSFPLIRHIAGDYRQIDLFFQWQHSEMMFRCPRRRPTGGYLNHVPRAGCSREQGPDFLTGQVKSSEAEVACGLGREGDGAAGLYLRRPPGVPTEDVAHPVDDVQEIRSGIDHGNSQSDRIMGDLQCMRHVFMLAV